MTSELLILVTLICWAAWGIFEKKALQQAANKDVVIILYILHICQIPVIFYLLNTLQPGWHLTQQSMIWSGMASATYAVALIAYLTAMSKTEASIVLGTTACYPIVSVFLASFLLGEKLLASRLVGVAISVLGIIGMSLSADKSRKTFAAGSYNLVILCVSIATLAWGIWGVIDKQAVSVAGALEVYLGKCIWDIVFLFIVGVIFKSQGHKLALQNRTTWYLCSLSTICLAVGGCSYLTVLEKLSASYVISITACYPVLMYLLAIVFLKEQFNKRRLAGLTLAVLGAVLVQLTKFS